LPLGFDTSPVWVTDGPASDRWAISMLRKGTVVLRDGAKTLMVTAPALILLNETLRPTLENARAHEMVTAYFHPSVVNGTFTIGDLSHEDPRSHYNGTPAQPDVYLVERFVNGDLASRIFRLGAATYHAMDHLFEQTAIEAREQRDVFWPCRTRSFFIQLLFQARMIGTEDVPPVVVLENKPHQAPITRALQYVHERFHEPIRLEDVARACATNRTSLNEAFRTTTGMTMHSYLTSIRMQFATTLLRDTALSVSEIVQRAGYSNSSHFTRTFKAMIGHSPSDYRTNNCWMF
jgi:AraC family L-rhamnose operon regulatory protein RhaS